MKWCVKAKERGPTLERGSWNHVNELVQVGCACVWMYHMWQVVCVVYARRHVAVRILVRTSLYSFFSFDVSSPGLAWAQPSRHHPRVPSFLSVWWRFYLSIIFLCASDFMGSLTSRADLSRLKYFSLTDDIWFLRISLVKYS